MNAALLLLLLIMPEFLVGPLAGKPWYQPRPGVTRQQLADAGAGTCALRTGVLIAVDPTAQIVTEQQAGRLCGTDQLLLCPAGWIGTGLTATCRQLPQGWVLVGARNAGTAAAETDATVVPHECMCSSGASCTAQKVNLDGTLAAAAALPRWTIAGTGQAYVNPSGTGCRPVACVETVRDAAWNPACPKQ
jgi:hypothetical protein